jgi:ribonuclease P protein component
VPAGPVFASIFKKGSRSKDALLLVCAAPNDQAYARLGVNVARKVASKAVARNRIKRQVRETFRLHQQDVANLDVVVIAQIGAGAVDSNTLRGSLREHLRKIAHKCKKS